MATENERRTSNIPRLTKLALGDQPLMDMKSIDKVNPANPRHSSRIDLDQDIKMFDVGAVKLSTLTTKFINDSHLEHLYQQNFIELNALRGLKICLVFVLLYFAFTGSNFVYLADDDEEVVRNSWLYIGLVYPPMFIILGCLYLLSLPQYVQHYQVLLSVIMCCWSFSFIAGGVHSMLTEWFTFVEKDMMVMLDYLNFGDKQDLMFRLIPGVGEFKNANWDGQTKTAEWIHESTSGTQKEVFRYYMHRILLPAATLNINLIRPMMVFVIMPFLRVDTLHYAGVAFLVSLSYSLICLVLFPVANDSMFVINKVLLVLFPISASLIMVFRNRDYEKALRLDFLHVLSVKRKANWATKQKEILEVENSRIRKHLQEYNNDTGIDMTAPIAHVLAELMMLKADIQLPLEVRTKLGEIETSISQLDRDNVFACDLASQVKESADIDGDTKDWVINVLTQNSSVRPARTTTGQFRISSSNLQAFVQSADNDADDMALNRGLESVDDAILASVKSRLVSDGWNTDMLDLFDTGLPPIHLRKQSDGKSPQERPLFYVMMAVFDYYELFDVSGISRAKFANFAHELDIGYIDNPYHNNCHGADVLNGVHHLISSLSNGRIKGLLTQRELVSAIVAAAIHDFRHPGRSNNFLIAINDDLALQYSDRSVLEYMHLSEAFFLLKDPLCDIFNGLNTKDYAEVRKCIIQLVLATDLGQHLELVSNLKTTIISEQDVTTNPMLLLTMVIKCADIGHASKQLELHQKWSDSVVEEFFLQGDDEKSRGLPISPFMNRDQQNTPKNQVGFFEFIVLPFYEAVSEGLFDEDFGPIFRSVQNNYQYWKNLAAGKTPVQLATTATQTVTNTTSSTTSSVSNATTSTTVTTTAPTKPTVIMPLATAVEAPPAPTQVDAKVQDEEAEVLEKAQATEAQEATDE